MELSQLQVYTPTANNFCAFADKFFGITEGTQVHHWKSFEHGVTPSGKGEFMPFIVWNDRLSVENESLDSDHRMWVGMLNELYDGILQGNSRQQVGSLLDRLVAYTEHHFAHEEQLFALAGYPEAQSHIHEHSNMAAWLREMRARCASGAVSAPSLESITFLKDWLFDHILGADHKYIPYMRGLGIR